MSYLINLIVFFALGFGFGIFAITAWAVFRHTCFQKKTNF